MRVLDVNGAQLGVMPTNQALRRAQEQGLDLVEITPNAVPPVCKIMDYGKFKYDESIRAKKARKAQKATQVKEIKFHPGTDVGDLQHKLKQIREFLGEGNKVKVIVKFKGREMSHTSIGQEIITKFGEECTEFGVIEKMPVLDGRNMIMVIGPKASK